MSDLTNTWENKVYNALLKATNLTAPTTVYLRLFEAFDSIENPSSVTEVSGGSYAPQAVTFSTPTDGAGDNSSAAVTFTAMPSTTIVAACIVDNNTVALPSVTDIIAAKTVSISTTSPNNLTFNIGDIDFAVQ
jgi:hypothetical protein